MATKKRQPKDWREARRWRAWEFKQKGWRPSKIAEALGVTRGAVSQWFKTFETIDKTPYDDDPKSGPPCRLNREQLNLLPGLLAKGTEAYGFDGTWTRRRVAHVIHREFGVTFSLQHVGNLLRQVGYNISKQPTRYPKGS